MKTLLLLLGMVTSLFGGVSENAPSPKSFMSDKTEVVVNLEVSGAEALCQTEDGAVWIGQYSGLTRYDSKESTLYKAFIENGVEHSVINVRELVSKENTLYIATSDSVFVYEDYKFSSINVDAETVMDITLDEAHDLLYISTLANGAFIYDTQNKTSKQVPGTAGKTVNDMALDVSRDNYYYHLDNGVYDKAGNEILLYPKITDIYTSGDVLYIGELEGTIRRYHMGTRSFLDDISVSDQMNKMLYSPTDKVLYVACENKGLCCVNLAGAEPVIAWAGNLENVSQLVDLMIDYEGNQWVASHFIGRSGVSIIARNALYALFYDDTVWQALEANDQSSSSNARNVYAVERYGDILYVVAAQRIYRYDLSKGIILPDNALMQAIDAYTEEYHTITKPKDIEAYDGKLFFAVTGIGLVEYDPLTEDVQIYDAAYVSAHIGKQIGDPNLSVANTMRSLRAFDGYLAIGYSHGLMKFDGTTFSVMATASNVLYINKSKDGKLLFNRSSGIFEVDDDFSKATEIPTVQNISGNRLKFLVDGDYIYYTLNSRLFRLEKNNGTYVSKEVFIPYVKGSLVELAKVEYTGLNGENAYKYVIASQRQVYIADSLEGERLENYEFYDSTNGLKDLVANSSGYYDRERQKYYFQSMDGVFVYDFSETRGTSVPVKMGLSSVELDGAASYGNTINVGKDVYRITINLSVFGFRPNKGHTIYYKMDGIDNHYNTISDNNDRSINYTNLSGGNYTFHAYAVDEYGQASNHIEIQLIKELKIYEHVWFWILVGVLALSLIVGVAFLVVRTKTKQAIKKQLEYKNITVESIQAIARTIDAKDEYTNGHSTRVGYYSKLIAENLGMSQDEVDNIYYIALLHDIGKIAIPDKILNKPGRLTDEEFAVMKSHTTRGAKILKGISTIPHIVEGAKYHHERYDGTGYPEGLKGEEIPFVARIICCADCFDAMASKRVYKEPFSLETITNEFKRCSGTQFDPKIAEVVIEMIQSGKLKPYSVDNTYLGEDGKTHRIVKESEDQN